jgi:hypothetical protein
MKRSFLKFPRNNYAAPIQSRRMGFREFVSAAYKSHGQKIQLKTDGLEGDSLVFVQKLNEKLNELPAMVSADELTEAMKGIKPEGMVTADALKVETDALKAILKVQGETITALETAGKTALKDPSLKGQIKAWLEKGEVKSALKSIKAGSMATIPEFELDMSAMTAKAPATMTFATVDAGGSAYLPVPQVDRAVIDLVRIQPTFFDYLIKGRTSSAAYVWINKINKQGPATAAMFIGEGVLKPLASFELETEISNAKKIAERMKASTEILEDIDGFASLIENELSYEVRMAVNNALLSGTLSSTVPAGITTIASAYTLTGISVDNPNNFDAIRAAVAQLRNLNFFSNLVVFINPVDAANMELTKADDSGVYMLPPFTSADGTRIAGVRIVEDNNIAVGNLLVADLSKFKVLIYKDFRIAWGWENDDFSKNLITVIGEMRLHSFHSANHTGAFLYDSFADIKAAIDSAGS